MRKNDKPQPKKQPQKRKSPGLTRTEAKLLLDRVEHLENRVLGRVQELNQKINNSQEAMVLLSQQQLILRRVINDALAGKTQVIDSVRAVAGKEESEDVHVLDWSWYERQWHSCEDKMAFINATKIYTEKEALHKCLLIDERGLTFNIKGKRRRLEAEKAFCAEPRSKEIDLVLDDLSEAEALCGYAREALGAYDLDKASELLKTVISLLEKKPTPAMLSQPPVENNIPEGAVVFGGS